jgi:hypothetical protein
VVRRDHPPDPHARPETYSRRGRERWLAVAVSRAAHSVRLATNIRKHAVLTPIKSTIRRMAHSMHPP